LELISKLEAELEALEADYEDVIERMEVQGETITLASGRLDELADAFEQQALTAEHNLQRTSAFWVEKLAQARAAMPAAVAPSPPGAPPASAEPVASTADADRDMELERLQDVVRAQADLLALQEEHLTSATLKAEIELQSTAAFWVGRVQELEEQARKSDAKAAALEEALSAREQRAERELQSTSAFWIHRVTSIQNGLKPKAPKNKKK